MKLKKGSAEARAFMAKIRAKRKKNTKAVVKTKPTFKPSSKKKAVKKTTAKKRVIGQTKDIGHKKYAIENYKSASNGLLTMEQKLKILLSVYRDKEYLKNNSSVNKSDVLKSIKYWRAQIANQKKYVSSLKKFL